LATRRSEGEQHDCYVFFFFSSRRRHTRSKRDWSSDVCYSDLGDEVMIDRETIALCTDRAQKLDRHHNLAREIFVEQMLDELTDLVMGLDAQMLRDVEEGFEDEVRRVDAALERNSDSLMPTQEG